MANKCALSFPARGFNDSMEQARVSAVLGELKEKNHIEGRQMQFVLDTRVPVTAKRIAPDMYIEYLYTLSLSRKNRGLSSGKTEKIAT